MPQDGFAQLEAEQKQAQPVPTTGDGFAQLAAEGQQQQQAQADAGTLTNDVGNKVIVPKEGESFADTMQRAAQYGKTVTQPQIDAEMATAPRKVAQVLGTAPVLGAAGAAGLAAGGEPLVAGAEAAKDAAQVVSKMAAAHPEAAKLIARMLVGGLAGEGFGHPIKGAVIGALLKTLIK